MIRPGKPLPPRRRPGSPEVDRPAPGESRHRFSRGDPQARFHVFSWQITGEDMDTFKLYLKDSGPDALVGLTYHFITDNGPADTSTPVANFKAQMAYLKEAGFTVVPLPQVFAR